MSVLLLLLVKNEVVQSKGQYQVMSAILPYSTCTPCMYGSHIFQTSYIIIPDGTSQVYLVYNVGSYSSNVLYVQGCFWAACGPLVPAG